MAGLRPHLAVQGRLVRAYGAYEGMQQRLEERSLADGAGEGRGWG